MFPATAQVDPEVPCQVKEARSKRPQPAGFHWQVQCSPIFRLGSGMEVA